MFMMVMVFFMIIMISLKIMKKKDMKNEFNNPIECGFKNMEKNRSSLSMFIFMNLMIFILLEMEISFIMIEMKKLNFNMSVTMFSFFLFLIVISFMEWKKTLLEWYN